MTQPPTVPPGDRLREHPSDRFDTDQAVFDLAEAAATLRAEPGAGQHGHRQQVLHRHGPTTIALFVFEQGASLPPHTTDGVVIIQAVQGELRVGAGDREHKLPAGSLVTLAPGVRHKVYAVKPSVMLLTVNLRAAPKQARPPSEPIE